jgi:glycerol-3-phosphate dehydrogenase (NAD(P)+)
VEQTRSIGADDGAGPAANRRRTVVGYVYEFNAGNKDMKDLLGGKGANLAEMTRLGTALGADQSTFAGLAGLGDLVLTCTGSLSRNRAVGIELGKGRKLEEVLRETETVAEGVVTAQSARDLAAREGVEMPIVDTVNRVLFEGQPARSAIVALMTRELRSEVDE